MHQQLDLLGGMQAQLVAEATTTTIPAASNTRGYQLLDAVDALCTNIRRVQAAYDTAAGFLFSPRLLSTVQMAQLLVSSW